nr:YopX family protein [uncultured Mogibacterium sp.]
MREIKFRAWDKELKNWADYAIAYDRLSFLDENTGWWKTDKEGERFILCQYTGLKDNEDREIYEGDIVKAISFARWIGVVKYSDENQAFIFDDLDKKYRGKSTVFINQFDGGFEILGNIYENPELLKEATHDV